MSDDGPIQKLEPALEPLTKGLAPGQPVRKKTVDECRASRGVPGAVGPCALCCADPLLGELCKL